MAADWHSTEAFERDLWSFSEQEQMTWQDAEVSTPLTILEYNARIGANNIPSIFENPCPAEDVTYVVSGRGRGGVSTLIRPGAIPQADRNSQFDLQRRIREVSGMGYSNELIEQSFKAVTGKATNGTIPEIKLQPVPSTSSASSYRLSPGSTASVQTPGSISRVQSASSSKRSSPNNSPNKSTASDSRLSSYSSRNSTSPCVLEPEPVEVVEVASNSTQPLPLSVILNQGRRGKKQARDNLNPEATEYVATEVQQNGETNEKENVNLNAEAPEFYPNGVQLRSDYWWNRGTETSSDESISWRRRDTTSPNRYFRWSPKKTFNISSSKEFPALK